MPFTQPQIPSDNPLNPIVEDKRTTETIQHARLITHQHKTLAEVDIKTAEATAKMVNAGKIFSGLLVYLMSPKRRVEGAAVSMEPQKIEEKTIQPTERAFSDASKRPSPLVPAHELQSLGPVVKHKRVVSTPGNDVTRAMATETLTPRENSAPEDPPAIGKSLSDDSAATIGSSKGGKASKKSNKGRKRLLNEQIRSKVVSTVSAYPTQRPPRKKPAKKSNLIKEALQEQRLGPGERDQEQVPAARQPASDGSDHDDYEKLTHDPSLLLDGSLQKDRASSPQSSLEGHEEPRAHTPEEVLNQKRTETEVELVPSDVFHGEDLITTTEKPVTLSLPTGTTQEYGSGLQGLLWAYATGTKVDKTLHNAGIYLWEKPNTHFCARRLLRTEKFGYPALAPVVISHERAENDEPIIDFNGDTVYIVPHEQVWEDVRYHEFHPDFLVPWKLAEYQACEAAGYQVWRHDRDLLKCRRPGCGVLVSDYHRSAVFCLGCGPKSVVRYCSLQHQLGDVEGHWRECGTWKVILKRIIDHTTAPSKFDRMYPAIKQRHGSKTAALHRQRLYCALTYGHYTLFHPASTLSATLCWPKQDPNWPEMDGRIERLLNVAFLDSWNHAILGYLYRLLRELLRARGEWFENTERLLKLQLESEFSGYLVNTHWHDGDAPCQCEWSGKIFPQWNHLSRCWAYAPVADENGPVQRRRCIKATLEDYEERFWILRAWRQQHPVENNWRLRAAGYGFSDMVPDEECYKLGPGWTGWGGERDNICQDLGNQRGKV